MRRKQDFQGESVVSSSENVSEKHTLFCQAAQGFLMDIYTHRLATRLQSHISSQYLYMPGSKVLPLLTGDDWLLAEHDGLLLM